MLHVGDAVAALSKPVLESVHLVALYLLGAVAQLAIAVVADLDVDVVGAHFDCVWVPVG